jgi:hypothetical protein
MINMGFSGFSEAIILKGSCTVVVILIALGVYQIRLLHKAHGTFYNYYAFRGCVQLIKREPTYSICKTRSGHIIEIVLYHGKWYLKGDLPTGLLGHLL